MAITTSLMDHLRCFQDDDSIEPNFLRVDDYALYTSCVLCLDGHNACIRTESELDAGHDATANLHTAPFFKHAIDGRECGLSHGDSGPDADTAGCRWAGRNLAYVVHPV